MYEYANQFHLTDELATALTKLISKKEGKDYVCKMINVTIPQHQEEVFGYRGGVEGLSGAEIAYRTEKYGQFYLTTVPETGYNYVVVMDRSAYEHFQTLSFEDVGEINTALRILCKFVDVYNGVISAKDFCEKFPYLEEFFVSLDKWRAENKRATIDDEILNDSYRKVLNNLESPLKKAKVRKVKSN